jgi:hypothetical protein
MVAVELLPDRSAAEAFRASADSLATLSLGLTKNFTTAAGAAMPVTPELVQFLVEEALSTDGSRRVHAAHSLQTVRHAIAAPMLMQLAADPDPAVVEAARKSLLGCRDYTPHAGAGIASIRCGEPLWVCSDPRALPALAKALDDPNIALRRQALPHLAWMGSPAASRVIAGALRDPDPLVRILAFEALSYIRAPEAAGLLMETFKAARKEPLPYACFEALAKRPEAETARLLAQMAAQGDEADRKHAYCALVNEGLTPELPEQERERIMEILGKAYREINEKGFPPPPRIKRPAKTEPKPKPPPPPATEPSKSPPELEF